MPTTVIGRWSVGLNTLFLVAITASLLLVEAFKLLSFDNRWWDITVAIAFPTSIIALITGIIAVRKHHDRSVLIYLSVVVGVCTILFALLHSLFISD
ncbi:MAG: hypothetical protein NUV80_00070 [Candidatus Berkelbacteria bacterium]|nr:hypothetical protein [Candidatus Berkelbacteria bacterium]MCR4306947.1 hypothetical protein [Candidatus Berkelbacteria bacterium]